MIGVSVSDILKVLDQVPGWKAVMGLPKRLQELEDRVAALEGKPTAKAAEACPLCESPMKVTRVEEHPVFGILGAKEHTLTCTGCTHTETRRVDPSKPR
ncbi:hypothetical protein ASF26_14495 [Methylobacterium sp. Leaf93]|nr:hypothetical protein ASF26_14495 [Methylobacterium sp. Leaf93]